MRHGGRLTTAGDPELVQQGRDMVVDGLGRQREAGRDLGVGQALLDQREDLDLAGRQAGDVGGGRSAGPARQVG